MATENRFAGGMNSDIDDLSLPPNMYRDAVNMELTEENGYQSLRNLKGTELAYRFPLIGDTVPRNGQGEIIGLEWAIDTNGELDPVLTDSPYETIIAAFPCTSKYRRNDPSGGEFYHAPSSIVFTLLYQDLPNPFAPVISSEFPDTVFTNRIYLLNHSTGNLHLIFQGRIGLTPNMFPTAGGGADQSQIRELDAYQTEERGEDYCYWIDNEFPLRRIRLFVADDLRFNCSSINFTPIQGIGATYLGDADILTVFKLFPPDALAVDSVVPDKGNLPAGSYQFAYRYYNTANDTFSKFSLFTNPLPIVNGITNADNPNAEHLNDMDGQLPGAITRKAIKVRIDPHPKTGLYSRMKNYYNAVQLAVVKNTDGRVERQEVAFLLQPNRTAYTDNAYLYTGTEAEAEAVATTLTIDESPIDTAKTLEYNDGRLLLANITYHVRQWVPTVGGAKAKVKYLRVSADPMRDIDMGDPANFDPDTGDYVNGAYGYYSELNCQKYRGHWRGELYREFITYGDKYGNFSEPGLVDFRLVPNSHAAVGGTPAAATTATSIFSGTLATTKFYLDSTATRTYFMYGSVDTGTGPRDVFLHLQQAMGSGSVDLTVVGGYFLDYSDKIYTPTSITFTAGPDDTVPATYTVFSGAIDIAPVFGERNWADPASPDWKFAPRNDPAGHLFEQGLSTSGPPRVLDYIRAFGLELSAITAHPEWAVCIAVTRMERKRDILGQTPLVHSAAVQNVPTMFPDPANQHNDSNYINKYGYVGGNVPNDYNPDFRKNVLGYDYDGAEDTLVPRILAYGATRHLTAFRNTFGNSFATPLAISLEKFNYWTVQWNKAETMPGQEANVAYAAAFNGVYLYPPEYMAHLGSIYRAKIFLDGTEYLDAVDCVALEAFSGLRSGPSELLTPDTGEPNTRNFFKSDYAQYAWVFSPFGHDAYFSSGARSGHYNNSLHLQVASIPDTAFVAIQLKKGFALDYGDQPVVLDDSYVRRPGLLAGDADTAQWGQDYSRIRKLNNLQKLVAAGMEAQAGAANVLASYPVPAFPEINQRAIFAILEDRSGRFIYDPTDLLTQAQFSALFGSGYNGNTLVFARKRQLEQEQWWAVAGNNPTGTSTDAMVALQANGNAQNGVESGQGAAVKRRNYLDNNYMMVPGNCILMPVVNIVKKLDDFRYGNADGNLLSIFTGAYQALDLGAGGNLGPNDGQDGAGNGGVTLEVFGGDCYITRMPITVRDNAVAARGMKLASPILMSDPALPDRLLDQVNRPQNHSMFVEVVDMWLESEVNGHYVNNKDKLYPFQVRQRDAGGAATNSPTTAYGDAAPKYQYPATATSKVYDTPRQYLYNQGYSSANNLKVFDTLPTDFPRLPNASSRVHFSQKMVRNTLIRGFDTWLVDDFSDLLDPAYGPVSKLMFRGNNQVVALQERGVPVLMVGAVQSYDVNGNVIGLSSAQVVGNVSYLSTAAGTKYLSSVKRMDGTIYFLDSVNGSISVVGGDGVKSLSAGRVWALVKRVFGSEVASRSYGNIVGMVDVLKKKYVPYDNGDILLLNPFGDPTPATRPYAQTQGVSFNAQINAFEGRLLAPNFVDGLHPGGTLQVGYVNRVSGGTLTFDFINKWKGLVGGDPDFFRGFSSNGEIHAFTDLDRSLMFGGPKEVSLDFVANQAPNVRKVFDVVLINGANIDIGVSGRTKLRMVVPNDLGDQDSGMVEIERHRETLHVANRLRDTLTAVGARMRGVYARIGITVATVADPEPKEVILRTVETKVRESHRST